jgi:hypothetical protein
MQPTVDTQADTEADITTRADRVAHAYCPVCVPTPTPGMKIKALCGITQVFSGPRPSTKACVVCHELAGGETLPCGHPGEWAND